MQDEQGGFSTYVMPASGGTWKRIGPEGMTAWLPAWSPDGERIACVGQSGGVNADIWILDVSTYVSGKGARR